MVFIIDLGLLALIILIMSVIGIAAGSVVLNSIMNYAWLPIVGILIIVHIIFLIMTIKDNFYCGDDAKALKISGNVIYGIGEMIRGFISIAFFACVCKGFLLNFAEGAEEGGANGFLTIVFSFVIVILDLFVALLVFGISLGVCYISGIIVEENGYTFVGGIVNLLLSVIFFILVEALIGYGYPNASKALFENTPFLNMFFSDPILYKIFRCFTS